VDCDDCWAIYYAMLAKPKKAEGKRKAKK